MTQLDYASTPLVSVVMAVYNGEEYLDKAIESILNQSYKNFEFIIINDGSNDHTQDILNKYQADDSRIVTISRENKGLVASLNEGIAKAKGTLIARMDADDIALPFRFDEQVEYLNQNSDVVCVGTSPIIIDEDGDELTVLSVPTNNNEIQSLLLSGHCPIEHPSVMYRTESIKSVGCYRREFETAEDYDLWLRLGEIGKLANINKPLLKYRYLSTSISAKNQTKQAQITRLACEQACKRRGVEVEYTASNEWRMKENRQSKFEFTLKFGWWAFQYKNKEAAIKYAKRAMILCPVNTQSWKLFLASLFKL